MISKVRVATIIALNSKSLTSSKMRKGLLRMTTAQKRAMNDGISTDRLFKVFNIVADNERAFVFVFLSVFVFVFVLLSDDMSTDRFLKIFDIIADNERAFVFVL